MRPPGAIRVSSYRRGGRLVPYAARGLRAGSVALKRGEVMDWHSTDSREELLIALRGRVSVEVCDARRRIRRSLLRAGSCLFLPSRTTHRVVNRSRVEARYLYITAPIK